MIEELDKRHQNKTLSPTCRLPSKFAQLSSWGKHYEPGRIFSYNYQGQILAFSRRLRMTLDVLGASARLQFVNNRPDITAVYWSINHYRTIYIKTKRKT